MSRYYTRDVLFTPDGDFGLDEHRDIALASGNVLLDQNVRNPLKSSNPDWESDAICADLEDLIGMENTRETAEHGKTKIKNALMKTEFFNEGDIWIEAKPLDTQTIVFFVFINSPFSESPVAYEVPMDLGLGATIRRIN